MDSLPNLVHPSEILVDQFMNPEKLSIKKLAIDIGLKVSDIDDMCNGKIDFTKDFCYKISNYFGNSFIFWINLHIKYKEDLNTIALLEKAITLITNISDSTKSIEIISFDFSKDSEGVFEIKPGYQLFLKSEDCNFDILGAGIENSCFYFKINNDLKDFVLFQSDQIIEVYKVKKLGEY